MILIIRSRVTAEELQEMLRTLETYVKLAVDVRLGVLAGGGALHADCESALLEAGSKPEDIWGADWNPRAQQVTYQSLINIRPRQGNRSMEIQAPRLRESVERIVRSLLGGV